MLERPRPKCILILCLQTLYNLCTLLTTWHRLELTTFLLVEKWYGYQLWFKISRGTQLIDRMRAERCRFHFQLLFWPDSFFLVRPSWLQRICFTRLFLLVNFFPCLEVQFVFSVKVCLKFTFFFFVKMDSFKQIASHKMVKLLLTIKSEIGFIGQLFFSFFFFFKLSAKQAICKKHIKFSLPPPLIVLSLFVLQCPHKH